MSNVSRRSFVKGAGLTGAAVAASAALTGVAVADEAAEAEVTSAPDYSSWLPAEPEISDDMVEERGRGRRHRRGRGRLRLLRHPRRR